jgi:sugar lactone lactonase YvrE
MCEGPANGEVREQKRRGIVSIRLAVLAVVAFMLPVAAAGAAVDVEVVVDYDALAGELPEGLAVDKRGDVFVSISPLGQIRKIARDGSESMLAAVVPPGSGNGPLGLAVDAPGNVYAAVATFDPATSGVYKIARDGTFARLPGTEEIEFPNGVTLDKEGNVYVTDTTLGAVWRVPAAGGLAELWFRSPLLEGDGRIGFGVPLGANGIAFRHNEIVVGNTELERLVRIPIEPDGSSGSASVFVEDPDLFAVDGLAFDVHGNLWAAVIAQSTIVRVSPSGDIDTIATAEEHGLDWASSIAFGKNGDLWAVNFAIGPPGGPGPGLLRLAVGVKGQPVP